MPRATSGRFYFVETFRDSIAHLSYKGEYIGYLVIASSSLGVKTQV